MAWLIFVLLLMVICYELCKQSFFRYSKTCVQVKSHTFYDIPVISDSIVNDMIHKKTKQHGMRVKAYKFTESELQEHCPSLMNYVREAEFLSILRNLCGFDVNLSHIDIFGRLYSFGDKIHWHYDVNNTDNKRITAILHVQIPHCNTSYLELLDPCTKNKIVPSTYRT